MSLDPPQKNDPYRSEESDFEHNLEFAPLWMAGIFVDHLFMVPIAWLLEAEDLRALKSVKLLEI